MSIPWGCTEICFILHLSTLFPSPVSQPGNSSLPLVIFRGPGNTEEENESFSPGGSLLLWFRTMPLHVSDWRFHLPHAMKSLIYIRKGYLCFCCLPCQIQHFTCAWVILPWTRWGLFSPGNHASTEQLSHLVSPSPTCFVAGKLWFGVEVLSLPAELHCLLMLLPCASGDCLCLCEPGF